MLTPAHSIPPSSTPCLFREQLSLNPCMSALDSMCDWSHREEGRWTRSFLATLIIKPPCLSCFTQAHQWRLPNLPAPVPKTVGDIFKNNYILVSEGYSVRLKALNSPSTAAVKRNAIHSTAPPNGGERKPKEPRAPP